MSVFSRKRRVRLHFADDAPSVEGFQNGRRPVGGHYIIEKPKLLEATDRTIQLTGHLEVPAERVYFVQVNP